MSINKKRIYILFIVLFSCLVIFISKVTIFTVTGSDIPEIKENKITLYVGYENYKIDINNLSKNASVTYQLSDEAIAEASKNGIITPLSAGKATVIITIKQSKKIYTSKLEITVKKPYIIITNKISQLNVKEEYNFEVKAAGIKNPSYYWYISDTFASAINNSNGEFISYKPGQIKVTVMDVDSKKKSTCYVEIVDNVNPESPKFEIINKPDELWIDVPYKFKTNYSNDTVLWSVSDSTIASISKDGIFNAKKKGVVIVTAENKNSNEVFSYHVTIEDTDKVIQWKESIFEDSVRRAINKKSGDITIKDVLSIKLITISPDIDPWDSVPLDNLDDFKYFINLEELIFSFTYICNVSLNPLTIMTNLKKLDIYVNGYPYDIESLGELENLEDLTLYMDSSHEADLRRLSSLTGLKKLDINTDAESLDGLESLSQLEELHISSYTLKNISALSSLHNILKLGIFVSNNEVIDFSPIENLTRLTDLSFQVQRGSNEIDISFLKELYDIKCLKIYSAIKNLDYLKNLINLTDLTIYSDILSDISAVKELQNLEFLSINSPILTDIYQISSLNRLKELRICYSPVEDITSLYTLENLNELYLYKNSITTLGNDLGDANISSLEKFTITDNPLTDINVIKQIDGLKELSISYCDNLTDISPIAGCDNLEKLYIGSCKKLMDLEPLSKLQSLKSLSVIGLTSLTNLDFLSSLPDHFTSLKELELGHLEITDLTPVAGLNNLITLCLEAMPVTKLMLCDKLINLEVLSISLNEIDDITVLRSLKNVKYLTLCGNNIQNIDTLGELSNLEKVYLGYLKTTDITPLTYLTKLKKITLIGVPVDNIDIFNEKIEVYKIY